MRQVTAYWAAGSDEDRDLRPSWGWVLYRFHNQQPVALVSYSVPVQRTLVDRVGRFGRRALMSTALFEFRLKRSREREARLWREGKLGFTPHSRKQDVVRGYLRKHGIRTFVETGTYLGEMVQAVSDEVDAVHSIELDNWLFRRASRKFAHNKKVHIYHGDSSEILPAVVASLDGPALFWLDAHYSAGITARGAIDTPIVSEFETVLARSEVGHVLLADDANSFTGNNGYPLADDVLALCRKMAPHYISKVEDNIIQLWPAAA